ncbi:carboxymuconolactone decarboxylase family protein [Elizabethkingia meningoseptica]|uniref:Carboxymuconolactone decarboxylase-like domain-containing protein n=2 Tax=Elizabethkingia TaxID=308865 RepID=A0A1V3U0Y7_ELIME|nr:MULTISPECIES: carboxymuconolactone decarboxylase family protein [Elizabethkingia]AQX06140.1 hypothetical protein BBD33_13145 [Elizabethkingia meningoseptica]AQX13682.1 hypothetical protein BBD35_15450 [Elizabethkingia meningoseptica]AQX48186.1 hypothetical protein B5G46_13135 [Elizabethkingia meningoseptica]EJK5327421.1 carboxymuconolactone decarboxylase family protein [Elizabethkingia meningoseptica]EOR29475.1 alkylhydroperoxidase [Elizabethkingia meningoseptica ATCC 13253 = NBRC 12535]
MEKRIKIDETEPQLYKAMFGLESALVKSDLSKNLKELIKIRASQINNCAFCLDMHTKDALKNGEVLQRLLVLSAWREASYLFTEEEQAALAMTEEITLIHKDGLSEATYQNALKFFTKNQVAQIIMAIVTINAWNRIGISTHLHIEG